MTKRSALLLLGGTWHDFDGFAGTVIPLLASQGWQVTTTYNPERLRFLVDDHIALVISYTCFSRREDQPQLPGPYRLSETQLAALTNWVHAGGALLALHAATVLGESDAALGALLGGVFVEHPPEHSFTVYPLYNTHPLTEGLSAFTVRDELYFERCYPDVQIHWVAIDRGVAYPVVWSKTEGHGRVVHIALGHSAAVWNLEAYRKLLLAAVSWLT